MTTPMIITLCIMAFMVVMLVFDYLAGNTDNHLKNISLLYGRDLHSIRLAPAYDIVSTVVYPSAVRDMALSVGGEINLDRIGRREFEEEARKDGLGVKMAMKRFDFMCENFSQALRLSAEKLVSEGFLMAADISRKIEECRNLSI